MVFQFSLGNCFDVALWIIQFKVTIEVVLTETVGEVTDQFACYWVVTPLMFLREGRTSHQCAGQPDQGQDAQDQSDSCTSFLSYFVFLIYQIVSGMIPVPGFGTLVSQEMSF